MMSPRAILSMAILFCVLSGLYAWQRASRPAHRPVKKEEEKIAGVWEKDQVYALRIFHVDEPEKGIAIDRAKSGWTFSSWSNARVDSGPVERLMNLVKGLTGERKTGKPTTLEELELTDESGLHLVLLDQNEEALQHLVLGIGAEGAKGGFVRRREDEQLYWMVDTDLRGEIGVDEHGHPRVEKWLDKTVVELDTDEVKRLELRGPEKILVIERLEVPDPKDPEKKIFEWALAEPRVSFPVRKEELEAIVNSFTSLQAEDVPDPRKLDVKSLGLRNPIYSAKAWLDGDEEKLVAFGRKVPGMEGQRYTMVRDRAQIYAVSQWKLKDLFRSFASIADLGGLEVAADQVERIVMKDRWREAVLVRGGTGAWTLEGSTLRTRSDAIDAMLAMIAELRPADLATGTDEKAAGLLSPDWSVVLTEKGGARHELKIGAERPEAGERYAGFSNHGHVLIVQTAGLERVFPDLNQLLELEPVFVRQNQIRTIEIGGIRLERDQEWTGTFRGVPFDVMKSGVDRALQAVTEFAPKDLVTGAGGKIEGRLRFVLADGSDIRIQVGTVDPEARVHFATVGDSGPRYRLSAVEHARATFVPTDLLQMVWPAPSARKKVAASVVLGPGGETKMDIPPTLQVLDVLEGTPDAGIDEKSPRLILTIDGTDQTLVFGKEESGKRTAVIKGIDALLILRADEVSKILGR